MAKYGQGPVTPELAERIAEAYFLCEQDRARMGQMLGFGRSVDQDYINHPFVRRGIISRVLEMRRLRLYTREEHIRKLQEIRDRALECENWRVGLAAEISVGRAAGLYENLGNPDDPDEIPASARTVENLTTDQIKGRLARLQAPTPKHDVEDAVFSEEERSPGAF